MAVWSFFDDPFWTEGKELKKWDIFPVDCERGHDDANVDHGYNRHWAVYFWW
jgi:hypothetical protein